MQFETILFDLGHTLVDFERAEDTMHNAYAQMSDRLVDHLALDHPEATALIGAVRAHVDGVVEDSYVRSQLDEVDVVAEFDAGFRRIGLSLPRELLHELVTLDHDSLTADIEVSETTLSVLGELKDRGLATGLVSNAHFLPELMLRDLNTLGIGAFIDVAIYSSGVRYRKPDPRIYEAALAPLAAAPEKTVFVGDRVREDILGPKALGMAAILTTEFRFDEGDHDTADAVISTIVDLPAVLSRVESGRGAGSSAL